MVAKLQYSGYNIAGLGIPTIALFLVFIRFLFSSLFLFCIKSHVFIQSIDYVFCSKLGKMHS